MKAGIIQVEKKVASEDGFVMEFYIVIPLKSGGSKNIRLSDFGIYGGNDDDSGIGMIALSNSDNIEAIKEVDLPEELLEFLEKLANHKEVIFHSAIMENRLSLSKA